MDSFISLQVTATSEAATKYKKKYKLHAIRPWCPFPLATVVQISILFPLLLLHLSPITFFLFIDEFLLSFCLRGSREITSKS